MTILSVRGLHHGWRGRSLLNGVDIDLRSGELVALLGRNGAGKSTLIRLMLGLEAIQHGDITLDDQPIGAMTARMRAKRLAYVPQGHLAPFPYSVRDIVALGRLATTGLFGRNAPQDEAAIDAAIETVGIGTLVGRPYTELSGGERQLVLIARALAQGAGLIILDEPMSALDYGNQLRLMARLRVLVASGIGILMTTHHPDHARAVANRAALLDAGRIVADGAPAEVITPASLAALYDLQPHWQSS